MNDAQWWEMLAKALMVDVICAEHMGDVGRSVRQALTRLGIESTYDDDGRPCWDGMDDWPSFSQVPKRAAPQTEGDSDGIR